MNDFRDPSDLRPAPRVAPTALLWVMFVVSIVATSVIVWTNPEPGKDISALGEQRCWPMCPHTGSRPRADPVSQANQATAKPRTKPAHNTGA